MTVASAVPGCAGRQTRGERPGCWLSFALEGPLGAPPALQVGCGAVAWQSVSPPGCGIAGQWHYQAARWTLGILLAPKLQGQQQLQLCSL